jgi:ADP-ribose pyrophosphatase YjhB (NUDIX family)
MSGDQRLFEAYGQRWSVSWCGADAEPDGKPHGSAAICLTERGQAVLVSEDGVVWDLPGGRPEVDEDWRATLDREVREEACAEVTDATLLGFSRGECVGGSEVGTVLVRSLWRASVRLLPWDPQHEMVERRLMGLDELARTPVGGVPDWFLERWVDEAQGGGTD